MLRNGPGSYGSVAKFFHWLVAVIVIALFGVGLYMSSLELSPQKLELYKLHKAVGATLLGLALLRLLWRQINPAVELPAGTPAIERFGANSVHAALYMLIIATPLCGWVMSSYGGYPVSVFGLFTLPDLVAPDKEMAQLTRELHRYLAWTLIILAALHASAALYHHFIRKDNILRRMLPFAMICLVPFAANAENLTPWQVDMQKSKIAFTANYGDTDIKGVFGNFKTEILFDPASLDKSRVKAEIPVAAIDSSNEDRDAALQSSAWFDASQFPMAIFESQKFKETGKNRYHVDGFLTIRDKNFPFGFDFALAEFTPQKAVMDAVFPLNRLDFGVGQGDWANEKQVAANVAVTLHIEASR